MKKFNQVRVDVLGFVVGISGMSLIFVLFLLMRFI